MILVTYSHINRKLSGLLAVGAKNRQNFVLPPDQLFQQTVIPVTRNP
ncbi:MAG: hypothetical protein PUP91_15635 [Rhizonema sp. PD37]|nr:hypothetical protein [Rhizonema sp. PD37]